MFDTKILVQYEHLHAIRSGSGITIRQDYAELNISNWCEDLIAKYSENIDNQVFLRGLIDVLNNRTRTFFTVLIIIFLSLFVIPFILQLSFFEGESVTYCLYIC